MVANPTITYKELEVLNPNSTPEDIAFIFLFTRPASKHTEADLLKMRDAIWFASQKNINLLWHLDPINTELNRRSSNKTFCIGIILAVGALILAATGPIISIFSSCK